MISQTAMIAAIIWAVVILSSFIIELLTNFLYGYLSVFSAIVPFITGFFLDKYPEYELFTVLIYISTLLILYILVIRIFKLKTKWKADKLAEYFETNNKQTFRLLSDVYEDNVSDKARGFVLYKNKKFPAVAAEGEGVITKDSLVKILELKGNNFIVKKVDYRSN